MSTPPATPEEYQDWLYDMSRNAARIMLVDLEHSAGTVTLGSLPWLSDTWVPYDDFFVRPPEIVSALDAFDSVGDIVAINPDTSVDWQSLDFRGYPCRWYFGDVEWPKQGFRQIASTIIDGCHSVAERQFKFTLRDGGHHLRRTFVSTASTQTLAADAAISWLLTQAGLPAATYTNVDATRKAYSVEIDVDERSRLDAMLRAVARSINAHVRVTQSGAVDIFRPELFVTPSIHVTEDLIAFDGFEVVDVEPAYKRVRVVLADGTSVTDTTGADTGTLDEEARIETLLTVTAEANAMLAEHKTHFATTHPVWRAPVYDHAHLIDVGDPIYVVHERLIAIGVAKRIRRTPMSPFTSVEVRV